MFISWGLFVLFCVCVSHVCAPLSIQKPEIKRGCHSTGAVLFVFWDRLPHLFGNPWLAWSTGQPALGLPVSASPELGNKLVPPGLFFCFCLFLCQFGEVNSSLHWLSHHPSPVRVTFGSLSQLFPISMSSSGFHCGGRTWIHWTPASASPVRRPHVCIPQLALGNFHFQIFNLKPCRKLGFIAINT